jgi:hypothetical protein
MRSLKAGFDMTAWWASTAESCCGGVSRARMPEMVSEGVSEDAAMRLQKLRKRVMATVAVSSSPAGLAAGSAAQLYLTLAEKFSIENKVSVFAILCDIGFYAGSSSKGCSE